MRCATREYTAPRGKSDTLPGMAKLRLIHWNATEARPRIAALRRAGHTVLHEAEMGAGVFTRWKAEQPDALVIDLTRLPSHGREVAVGFRAAKATRQIPLVFVEGAADKVAALRTLLPDASYTTWAKAEAAIRAALNTPGKAAAPVTPAAMMDRYAGRTLAQKLGLGEKMRVLLLDAPRDAERLLAPLPAGVITENASLAELRAPQPWDLAVCFLRNAEEFQSGLRQIRQLAVQAAELGLKSGHAKGGKSKGCKSKTGKLWLAWPKRTSPLFVDLTENSIREAILALGLVDYKVCAISPVWSGLAVALKK